MSSPSTVCIKPALGCVLLVLALALATSASAASGRTKPAEEAGAGKPAKVSFTEAPSHETAAAREKRLKRECKGRPDAGMCRGHTR